MVNHPAHYDKGNPLYEPYRVIREWGCNFNIGSAIKYLARYNAKWNPVEDLRKAIKYIEFEIEALEAEGAPAQAAEEPSGKADRSRVMKGALGMSDGEVAEVMEMNRREVR